MDIRDRMQNLKNLKFKDILREAVAFVVAKRRLISYMFLLILVGYCFYLWYFLIYNPSWSQEKKAEYIQTTYKESEVPFNKKRFEGLVAEYERRKAEYEKDISDIQDIFKGK